MQKFIIINGVARSGKDSVCEIFKQLSSGTVEVISTIDTVRKMASLCGCVTKTDKDRKFLSDLKYLVTEYNDTPFKDVGKAVADTVFVMCREPAEIQRLKEAYNATTLLIHRNVPVPDNSADQGVYDYEYDYTLYNTGTMEDLARSVEALVATM